MSQHRPELSEPVAPVATPLGSAASTAELENLRARLESREAGERLSLLAETFPATLVASTSAGAQSAVLLDLLQRHAPDTPVIWVDTGYHFGETYSYFETLKVHFNRLRFVEMAPSMTAARQEALHGRRWEGDAEELKAYHLQNKVEPMNRALADLGARCWVSGLRAEQSQDRSQRALVERQNRTLKAYPILDWSDADIDNYLYLHELPQHPLTEFGYVSIGDWHSSRPARPGESAELTRFNGKQRECGLHEISNQPDFQI